jgi:hypothetical protein
MTFFGKILVLVNVGFSFLLAGWAVAVYVNRVDWTDTPAKGDQPPGQLVALKDQLAALTKAQGPAQTAWRQGRLSLAAQEGRFGADRLWYAAQLEHLRSGNTAAQPIQALVYVNGIPANDRADPERPQMAPVTDRFGKPLLSLGAYLLREEAARRELDTVLAQYRQQIEEDQRLTRLLIGPKGLQQRLINERAKREAVAAELELIRPQLVNTAVESELVFQRRRQLQEWVKELEKQGVAVER